MPERFLNLSEAAQILHISEKEVSALVEQGKIPAYRIAGKFLRFDKNQIEKYSPALGSAQVPLEKDSYSLKERLRDFWYYNDFYFFAFLVIVLILMVIFYR